MKVLNRYLIKRKGKVIHSVFLVQYVREFDIALVERYRIVTSLPNPILMLFLGKNRNDFPSKQVGFDYFTRFIRFIDKQDVRIYEMPIDFSKEERVSVDFIDELKKTWFYQKPSFSVSSPILNKDEHWSISNDIYSLKKHFKSLFASEAEKITRKDFERLIYDTAVTNRREIENQYIEYYRNFNGDFYISEEEDFSIIWGEGYVNGINKPLVVGVIEQGVI